MRPLLLLTFLVALEASVSASDVKIVRTWPGYRTAESFMRVSEYFTGNENTGGQTYLRSQPEQREGYYFLTRVKNTGAESSEARLELQVITPASPSPVTYTYTVKVPRGQHVYQVGITGKDWPSTEQVPVAWRLAITDAQGGAVVVDESYLWSKPASSP